jgi:hypothetical protein
LISARVHHAGYRNISRLPSAPWIASVPDLNEVGAFAFDEVDPFGGLICADLRDGRIFSFGIAARVVRIHLV